jgi:hypothetical protein
LNSLSEAQLDLLIDIMENPDNYTSSQIWGFFNQDKVIDGIVDELKGGVKLNWELEEQKAYMRGLNGEEESEEEKKKRSEGAQQLLNDAASGNAEAGTYEWNGSSWVKVD